MCRAGMPAGVIGQKQAENMHAVQVPSNADGMRDSNREAALWCPWAMCAQAARGFDPV